MRILRSTLLKLASMTVLAGAAVLGTASASAGTSWSLGIAAPGVAIGINDPGPTYYQPPPVYSRPAPIYYQPAPPVYYRPAPPAYYAPPAPVYYEPDFRPEGRRFHRHHWDGDRHGYRRGWDGYRD